LFDDMIDWVVKKQFIVSIFIKTIHRLDFHHRSEISFDVTRWQKTHLMNTFLSKVENWLESKDNDLQR
jgi:hypothetical protein